VAITVAAAKRKGEEEGKNHWPPQELLSAKKEENKEKKKKRALPPFNFTNFDTLTNPLSGKKERKGGEKKKKWIHRYPNSLGEEKGEGGRRKCFPSTYLSPTVGYFVQKRRGKEEEGAKSYGY